jgi:hypothetical protein
MKKIATELTDNRYIDVMEKIQDIFASNNIGPRYASAILAHMVFILYKTNSTKEAYNNYLDKCKEYWDMKSQ